MKLQKQNGVILMNIYILFMIFLWINSGLDVAEARNKDAANINEHDACPEVIQDPSGKYKLQIIKLNGQEELCCPCNPGTIVVELCRSGIHNSTKCEKCPQGTYMNEFSHGKSSCIPVSKVDCPLGEYFIPSTLTSDSSCICPDGFYRAKSGKCRRHLKCPAGMGVTRLGNSFQNTKCGKCKQGFTSPKVSSKDPCVISQHIHMLPENAHLIKLSNLHKTNSKEHLVNTTVETLTTEHANKNNVEPTATVNAAKSDEFFQISTETSCVDILPASKDQSGVLTVVLVTIAGAVAIFCSIFWIIYKRYFQEKETKNSKAAKQSIQHEETENEELLGITSSLQSNTSFDNVHNFNRKTSTNKSTVHRRNDSRKNEVVTTSTVTFQNKANEEESEDINQVQEDFPQQHKKSDVNSLIIARPLSQQAQDGSLAPSDEVNLSSKFDDALIEISSRITIDETKTLYRFLGQKDLLTRNVFLENLDRSEKNSKDYFHAVSDELKRELGGDYIPTALFNYFTNGPHKNILLADIVSPLKFSS